MADDDADGFFSPPSYKRYALSGKIMLGAIIVLLFVVMLMICLHLYVRLYLISSNRRPAPRRRRRRSHFVFTAEPRHSAAAAQSRGLPLSVLKSLPVFVHSSKPDPDPICCAVCLSEFEENEIGRIIPKCNHRFHVGCIDMWFYSHVTCPLCRSEVKPETGSDNPADVAVSVCDPGMPEPVSGSGSGSTRSGEGPGCPYPNPTELPLSVELVASSDESISEGGQREIDDMSVHGTSRTTANFVKSLSFKRILGRDKRDGVSPSGNALTDTAERDLEKEETEAARSMS